MKAIIVDDSKFEIYLPGFFSECHIIYSIGEKRYRLSKKIERKFVSGKKVKNRYLILEELDTE